MKKLLLAAVCLSFVGSAVARIKEEKPASLEDLIFAVEKLSNVDKRLPNIKQFVADAKKTTDQLEKAYDWIKVLDIVYDAIIKQLVGVARGLTSIKGLGEKPFVKKLMDSINSLNEEFKGIPAVVEELEKALDARDAAKA